MGSEAFDPKVALDFMAGRRQCWGCGHKVSGDNFTHRYRFSDEKARPKLPLCPLLVEIERMACIMGVSIERFDTGRFMLCGFHAHHHMLGGGTSIYPHHCCLETISQFEKMIAFVQSPDANAERSQNAINARSLFESFTDERVSAALALRQKVRLREECQERLSYQFAADECYVNGFLRGLKEKLGIKEEKKPQPKPEGTAVQGSFAEAFSKATLQAAKSMPPTEEIIRDPFCLVLRQQKSESAGAVV